MILGLDLARSLVKPKSELLLACLVLENFPEAYVISSSLTLGCGMHVQFCITRVHTLTNDQAAFSSSLCRAGLAVVYKCT